MKSKRTLSGMNPSASPAAKKQDVATASTQSEDPIQIPDSGRSVASAGFLNRHAAMVDRLQPRGAGEARRAVIRLQRRYGNHYVQGVMDVVRKAGLEGEGGVHHKPSVGHEHDPAEREADATARVDGAGEPVVQMLKPEANGETEPGSPTGEAAPEASVSDAQIDELIAAMGLPPLPEDPGGRERALSKIGLTPQTAAEQYRQMQNEPSAGGAKAPAAETSAVQASMVPAKPREQTRTREVDLDNSGGQPLNPVIATAMGGVMGHDFSGVTVHQDGQAESMSAHAFATGNHIHFAQGKLDTTKQENLAVLGHELAHVKQQEEGRVSAPSQTVAAQRDPELAGNAVNIQNPSLEKEADAAGAQAASAVFGSVRGESAVSTLEATAQRQRDTNSTDTNLGAVQAKPVVQFVEPISTTLTLFYIAGHAVTLGEGLAAASAVVGAATATAQAAAATLATSNSRGNTLRLPETAGALSVSTESGKDIIGAIIRVLAAKTLKNVAAAAVAKTDGDDAAKEAAAKAAVEAQKDNAKDNATQRTKTLMQQGNVKNSREEVWEDDNGTEKDPTWGSVTISTEGSRIRDSYFGITADDWTNYDIMQPPGEGCEFFRSVVMSATCNDNTVEFWDYLMVNPTQLSFVDAGTGQIQAVGRATFGWEDSITDIEWAEANPITPYIIPAGERHGEPND